MINDRLPFAYIGAALTVGALVALPLPAQADVHGDTAKHDAHVDLAIPSAYGGGGGGGEEEAPSAKKPRKEIRQHRPTRHIAQKPRKHYKYFVHHPHPQEQVSVRSEHGGGGGYRHHRGHHGHHHNRHFTDDTYLLRQLRRYHSQQEALEAVNQEADHWLRRTPEKVEPRDGKGHNAKVSVREKPDVRRDSGRTGR
ncbi:hypothetical protein Ssi03_41680 [Sphaerisporangium siamense]|uniref:Secreted protein n=1 Tax=Sphaerisporangium siamense TaxID=795645 RepID=A0A7W7DCZ9_9ACTN|nr:hypothetical protein [Sphaerisporangium siamense]MBB4704565.1 hypothetical protein [Sphaerisporangium siamense]GII86178.1 hypothetical protein Ssi03_41680 [Sphaerisporangium siamense]